MSGSLVKVVFAGFLASYSRILQLCAMHGSAIIISGGFASRVVTLPKRNGLLAAAFFAMRFFLSGSIKALKTIRHGGRATKNLVRNAVYPESGSLTREMIKSFAAKHHALYKMDKMVVLDSLCRDLY